MPWSRTCVVSHWVNSCWAHIQQCPQEIWKGIATRSPTFRSPHSEPTSTTWPMFSWPRMLPTPMNGASGSYRCRSDPQMFDVVTRMTASVGSWTKGSGTSSTRTSRCPCQVTAFMRCPSIPNGCLRSRCPGLVERNRPGPSAKGGHERAARFPERLDDEAQVPEHVADDGAHGLLHRGVGRRAAGL